MAKQVTKTETLYRFDELEECAQDKVREMFMEEYNWAGEAMDSLKALAAHFGGRLADWSIDWADYNRSSAKFDMPEMGYAEARELMEQLGSYNPQTLKGNGDCKLTGVCHDEDAIDGARQWLYAQPLPPAPEDDEDDETIDLGEMMDEAFDSWMRACSRDYESQGDDEQVRDSCEANDYWFYANGRLA
jgi:hypothetical protein